MIRIQLLADTEYFSFFSSYFGAIEGIEIVGGTPDILIDATFLHPKQKLQSLSKLDSHHSIVISNSLTVSATRAQKAVGKSYQVIGMPILPHYFARQAKVEYAFSVGTHPDATQIEDLLTALGKSGEKIGDAIGGVFPRTLAMIINEAAFAVQESVASPADIDLAMKLGTNYPQGPLAWCDEVGADSIVAILDALSHEYGADRYRVASLLRRNSEARIRFTQPS